MLIDSEKLKQHYAWWRSVGEKPADEADVIDAIVDAQSAVDAVPVIRCKDCYLCTIENSMYICNFANFPTQSDGFCHRAMTKDDAAIFEPHYFEIMYGFCGQSWRNDELSSCRWNSRQDCENAIAELSSQNGMEYWITREY